MRPRCSFARAADILGIADFRKRRVIEAVALHVAAGLPHHPLPVLIGAEIAHQSQPALAQEVRQFVWQQAEPPGFARAVDLGDDLVCAIERDAAVDRTLMNIGEDEPAAWRKPARPAQHTASPVRYWLTPSHTTIVRSSGSKPASRRRCSKSSISK